MKIQSPTAEDGVAKALLETSVSMLQLLPVSLSVLNIKENVVL
jgi:hypothetical protein